MKMILLIIFSLIFLISCENDSSTTISNETPNEFPKELHEFPLDIGNTWYYEVEDLNSNIPIPYAIKKEIVDTTWDGYRIVKVSQYFANDSVSIYLGHWIFRDGAFYKDNSTSKNSTEKSYDIKQITDYFDPIGKYLVISINLKIDTVWTKITQTQIRKYQFHYIIKDFRETICNPYFLITYESEDYAESIQPYIKRNTIKT